MNTAEMLFRKYGSPTLTMEQLAEVMHYESVKSMLNAISNETFKVPTFKSGNTRLATVSVVAKYLDEAAHLSAQVSGACSVVTLQKSGR